MSENPWQHGRLSRLPLRQGVLFGRSYEDERIEIEAFGTPGRVCVIAASGETAAALAAVGHRVVAIDINSAQLAYARGRLLGAPTMIGTVERLMDVGRRAVATASPGWRLSRLLPVLASADPQESLHYWDAALDTKPLRALLASSLRPGPALAQLMQPEFAAFVPYAFDRVIRERLRRGLGRHGMAGNRFAWRLLAGREPSEWTFAQPANGGRVHWQVSDIVRHLEQLPAGHYDGLSLSNVTDGAPPEFAERLSQAAHHAVRPGAPIVWRTLAEPRAHQAIGLAEADASLIWGRVMVDRAGSGARLGSVL